MRSDGTWSLEVVEPDIDLRGWLFVPEGMDAAEQARWVAAAASEVIGASDLEGRPLSAEAAREILEAGLARRAATESHAVYQVWPPLRGLTAICHISVLTGAGSPVLSEPGQDAIVHPAEAEHIGPGLQRSTRRTVHLDEDLDIELASVQFVFDDGHTTLVVGLEETVAPLVTHALPVLVQLVQNLRLTTDHGQFAAVAPQGVIDEAPWDFEEIS